MDCDKFILFVENMELFSRDVRLPSLLCTVFAESQHCHVHNAFLFESLCLCCVKWVQLPVLFVKCVKVVFADTKIALSMSVLIISLHSLSVIFI